MTWNKHARKHTHTRTTLLQLKGQWRMGVTKFEALVEECVQFIKDVRKISKNSGGSSSNVKEGTKTAEIIATIDDVRAEALRMLAYCLYKLYDNDRGSKYLEEARVLAKQNGNQTFLNGWCLWL